MNTRLSRRRFLQVGAAGAAAAAAAGAGYIILTKPEDKVNGQGEGRLRVAWGSAINLDPLTASADSEIAFLNAVYDYLYDTNAGAELVPRLAASSEISEDGMQYTLTIRDGVTFHNGDALTIDDIIWTFDRLRAEGATADLYAVIDSVEAGEGNTVVFNLSAPNPDFLYDLSDNRAVIFQKDAANIGTEFNGSGPFRLESYTPDDRAEFTANADYWGGAPGVGTLEFIYFADQTAAVAALEGGTVDVVLRMSNEDYLALADNSAYVAVNIPTNGHDLARLRTDVEPGNNPDVLRALRLATDRTAINERVQLGFGAVGRDTPIGPLFSQYFSPDIDVPARDAEAAKELLASAGYEDGLDLKLVVPTAPGRVQLAEILAAQWEEAGIRVEIEQLEEAAYYDPATADNWLEATLAITPWGSRSTPQFYLNQSLKTGAVWNESHFSDPELDALIDRAGVSTIPEERVGIYQEIQRILIDRGPLIIPYFFAAFMVHTSEVSGIDLHPFAGRTNFNTATI
jgi:peptide/nickel transport system substrate-binding protein